ncbi:MAG: NAD(P)H-hydrate dehydratase [Chitinophagales bacterium]
MKILSATQIREADAFTIKHEPIASIDLMERAANACFNWLINTYDKTKTLHCLCGLGNNGGDGLAIARLLIEKNYSIRVYIFRYSDKFSANFRKNEARLIKTKTQLIYITENNYRRVLKSIPPDGIVIDAVFGSGLSRPIDGWLAKAFLLINTAENDIVSIDLPSGLFCENNASENLATAIKATITLSFQTPKLSFLLPSSGEYVGKFYLLHIGLHNDYLSEVKCPNYYVEFKDIKSILKKRTKFSHKGSHGHALLIAGSYGKMGAAILSAKACMRSGVGLLTSQIPQCGYEIIQTAIPEVMVVVDKSKHCITNFIPQEKYSALGIGPAIGREKQTQKLLKRLIENSHVPIVLDADALNILAENKNWLSKLPANSILTPHPKEFERLSKKAVDDTERLELQRAFAIQYKIYLILKGAHTSIACPNGDIFFNSTGNPGMATGGSGDVLTGIVTGLLAQGYSALDSCLLGVYIHGLAGELASKKYSQEAMIASDITESLGQAFDCLRR